jgi:hypothetical protein
MSRKLLHKPQFSRIVILFILAKQAQQSELFPIDLFLLLVLSVFVEPSPSARFLSAPGAGKTWRCDFQVNFNARI